MVLLDIYHPCQGPDGTSITTTQMKNFSWSIIGWIDMFLLLEQLFLPRLGGCPDGEIF